MTSDTSALIAETLAAHIDRAFGRGGPTCSCEAWSPSPRAKTFRDLAMEFRLHRADAILAALDGRLLPEGGETREEWGVWWHADSADGIRMSEGGMSFESVARRAGEARIGRYGIQGFTVVRRTHTRYETGDWSTKWERVGEPWWFKS